jgi:Domain of unknown function (DUF1338)
MKPAELIKQLWTLLWQEYRGRVTYARTYQQMIEEAGGGIANDHIAFRSLRLTLHQTGNSIQLGIPYLAKLIEACGYEPAGEYHFPAQSLYARHYSHPEQITYDLPKLFISELIVDDLPEPAAALIYETVQSGEFPHISLEAITLQDDPIAQRALLGQLVHLFRRPWLPPKQSALESVNAVSQYGAWVMIHGYAVNHFTGYVNHHPIEPYQTIAETAAGLARLGVPMKSKLEGGIESGLCQTATQSVSELVWVQADSTGDLIQIPWPYAYYEIAERYPLINSAGIPVLFEGFLNAQAQQLFEMTRRHEHPGTAPD